MTSDRNLTDRPSVDVSPTDHLFEDGATLCEASGESVCYYVAPEAPGTCALADPCSFDSAVQQLAGGDVLYFLAGSYPVVRLDKYFHFQDPGRLAAVVPPKGFHSIRAS